MPRTGRPKADNPKDTRVTVRLDAPMSKKLNQYCEDNDTTAGEAIRQALKKLLRMK